MMWITIAAVMWPEYTKKVRVPKRQNCFVISMFFDIWSQIANLLHADCQLFLILPTSSSLGWQDSVMQFFQD